MTEGKVVKEEYINGMGKWIVYEDLTMDLIEPSKSWIAKQEEMENENSNPTEPTQEDRILALEQALLNLLG